MTRFLADAAAFALVLASAVVCWVLLGVVLGGW